MSDDQSDTAESTPWKLFPLIAAAILFGIAAWAIGYAAYLAVDILVILFLGLLFGILLTRVSRFFSTKTPLSYGWSLAALVLFLLVVTAGTLFLFGAQLSSQLARAGEQAGEARAALREQLEKYPAIESLLRDLPAVNKWIEPVLQPGGDASRTSAEQPGRPAQADSERSESESPDSEAGKSGETEASSGSGEQAISQAANAVQSVGGSLIQAMNTLVQTTFGLLVNILLIFFVGLFLASNPSLMRDGVVDLAPPRHREETRRVLNQLGQTLWRWLLGRFASMVITGVGVGASLWLLGVPLAGMLGVVTGLLTFVPNIGAAIALALAVFMALPQGLATAGAVIGLYLAFQLVESYALTPLIEQYQVDLPPAVIISAQAVFGVLLGFLGALVASPIMVVLLVLKREVYQRHLLRSSAP